MSDSNKPPKPPPDDFSKTTPNIDLSDEDTSGWDKTDYRHPAQPPADDWGNTVNFRNDDDAFGGSSPGDPKVPDWGITQTGRGINPDDFGGSPDSGDSEGFGKTTPYFQLPQAEREKYLKPKKPSAEEQEQKRKEEAKKKKKVPVWAWVSAALFSMFMFAILLLGVIYLLIPNAGFNLTITDVPAGSQIFINDAPWGETTSERGSRKLPNLKASETKRITIKNVNFECESETITGKDGVNESIKANCSKAQGAEISGDCLTFKEGEYQKSRDCAYEQLKKLGDPPDVDDLLKAMNLYINHFDSNSATIREIDRKFLETAASYMKKIPEDVVIEVGGHTDSDGGDASNQGLSERRATAVRDELIKAGIKESQLTMKGYGEVCPKTINDTDDGKFQNRRIQYQRTSNAGCKN